MPDFPPVLRGIREVYITIPAEQSLTVTDIPAWDRRYKLMYTRKVGNPVFSMVSDSAPSASLFTHNITGEAELVTSLYLMRCDVYVALMKRCGTVGDIITEFPIDDPDYILYLLTMENYEISWAWLGDFEIMGDLYRDPLLNTDSVYAHVWFGCRNMTGETNSATVKFRNLKSSFEVGYFQ